MLIELAIATAMVTLTVLIHGAGIAGLARALRFDPGAVEAHHHFSPRRALLTLGVVLALFTLHGIEIWLYAALYLIADAVHTLEAAVYFSTITYSTLGYGDVQVSQDWRLVSAIESINGILLLGWSTAFFVTVVARLRK